MKYITLSLFCALLVFSACDFSSILSEDTQTRNTGEFFDSISDTLLAVNISGGFPGVSQQLIVDESGVAIFADNVPSGARSSVLLTQTELQNIIGLMVDNNIFGLRGPYVDPNVADAFLYNITFIHDNQRNSVRTDGFGAPDPLKKIVDAILALQKRITDIGLSLTLEAKPIDGQNQFQLKLTATNTTKESIVLNFGTSQQFDFYARQASLEGSPLGSNTGFWNWAQDKVFTASLNSETLAAGETLTYQVNWGGRDNSGNLVAGDVFIGAVLKSVPGGSAKENTVRL
jgi:hypothetical protein